MAATWGATLIRQTYLDGLWKFVFVVCRCLAK
jgi:hypothetical protein